MQSRSSFIRFGVLLVLAVTIFFPTMWFVDFGGASYAVGTAAASFFALAVCWFMPLAPQRCWRFSGMNLGAGVLFPLAALILQSLVAYAIDERFNLVRFGGSVGLFLAILAGAFSISEIMKKTPAAFVEGALYGLTALLVFMAVAGSFGWTPVTDTRFHHPLFIFAEPSHFALVFAPLMLWSAVTHRRTAERSLVFALALVLLLMVKNLTFFVLVGMMSVIVLRARALFLMACGLFLVVVGNMGYFMPRMQLTAANSNLSVLVWLQGWQEAAIGLRETMGVGLGFQQLGLGGAKGDIAQRIAELYHFANGINLLDGGTLGAKLVGEFGVLGIALVCTCLYVIFRAVRNLREIACGSPASAATTFFYCSLASFALDLFVRGTGYFSPSVLLFLAGVFGIWRTSGKNIECAFLNRSKAAP